ncbi:hypothetical protein QVD17_06910 [Tagetes erecta]|uniref:Myb-like domain-containing protein n=1 Tax=Tagetes erecta TaxID=13708 RepID=A0AAD8LGV1_TARER|nr:hypothetical protein QVD17_06910 [Tagetes erecta]
MVGPMEVNMAVFIISFITSSPSSIYCFIISLLHHLLPPRTSIYFFIIFFHQEHLLVASSSPSPSSAVVGISDLVRLCCLLMEVVFIFSSEKNDESKQVQRSNVLTFAVSFVNVSRIVIDVWIDEEVDRFYKANKKYGKDWKKVAAMVRTRHPEMVEALYTMNRAYLSLPE